MAAFAAGFTEDSVEASPIVADQTEVGIIHGSGKPPLPFPYIRLIADFPPHSQSLARLLLPSI